jgi:protein RecA
MVSIEDTIAAVVKRFDKQYGPGAADKMATWGSRGYVPTGLLALDYVIGRPGWPLGRYSELAGPWSSAKSAIMGMTIGTAQAAGFFPILLDLEHSYDQFWMRSLFGVDPDKLLCLHPENIEAVFDHMKAAIEIVREMKNDSPIVMVVDSVSGQPSFKESETKDGTESRQMAEHAKIISAGVRRNAHIVWNENVAVIFISQLRDNPGIMYGTNTHKLGGKAIEFHSGLLVETKRRSFIKKGGKEGDIEGYKLVLETKKNKFAPPGRRSRMEYNFYTGFDREGMMVEFMGKLGMVREKQGWYEYDGKKCRRDELKYCFPDDQLDKVYSALGITADATYEDMLEAMKNTKSFELPEEGEEIRDEEGETYVLRRENSAEETEEEV